MKNDLHALSQLNDLFKYADNTTLLIPEHTDTDIGVEFCHIKAWASTNQLSLNLTKTKEIVFRRPRAHNLYLPPAIDNIEQLDCCKLLGAVSYTHLTLPTIYSV